MLLVILPCAAACREDPAAGARVVYRRAQRAYEGAPPVTPHPVEALQRQDCVSCHEKGLRLDDGTLAPSTPHPHYANCRQCHVEQVTSGAGLAANTFSGWRGPARGSRAHSAAPPTIPHDLASRSRCLGCHDALGGSPIRTPHPDRVNCLQCHVPMGAGVEPWRDNVFAAGGR